MRARHGVTLVAAAVVAAFVACSDYEEVDAPATDAGADTGVDAPSPPAVADAAALPEAAPPVVDAAVPCEIVYVAPDGDDGATGCAIGSPKKTINGALMVARSTPSVREIHACTGVYTETRVTLDVPVSLLGGFGCTQFKPVPDAGHPSYPEATATAIESEDSETLVVTGAAIGRAVRVDGLTLRSTGRSASTTLLVRDKAAPSVSNVRVRGLVPFGAVPTIGVAVTSGASPDIDRCAIDGGNGRTLLGNGFGSIGVKVASDAGTPHIHDSIIFGGSGEAIVGSVGLLLEAGLSLAGPAAVERNFIFGGTGRAKAVTSPTTTNTAFASIGVNAEGIKAFDFLDNVVDGGRSTCQSELCVIGAMTYVADGGATVRIQRNRFHAGEVSGAKNLQRFVLSASGGTGAVTDNQVHLGKPSADVGIEVGISLRGGNGRIVAHNTIAGAATPGTNPAVVQAFVEITSNEKGARILDNLLLGSKSTSAFGVVVKACDGATLGELRGNIFTGLDTAAFALQSSCAAGALPELFTWIASLEQRQNLILAGSASANHRLAADCVGEAPTQCTVDATCAAVYPACIPSLVAFDVASSGVNDFTTDNWRPKAASPVCLVSAALDAPDTSAISSKDVSSRDRIKPATIGAYQGCE